MNGRDEELLSAYYDGELPDEEKLRAEQLLTDDVSARETLDDVAEIAGWLRELPRASAPAGLHDLVLARIRAPAATLPLKPAPARARWRHWAAWTAVSAAGLLVAAALYRNELVPLAQRERATAVSAERSIAAAPTSDFKVASHSSAVPSESLSLQVPDPVQVAMSNSAQFQHQLADLLKNGETPVAGEEFSHLSQVGDQVVVIKYRIVDVEKLPGEVQLVLTNNGIAEVPGPKAGLDAFAYTEGTQKLDAFYVEAPEPDFTSAIAEITNLDGVTAVTANNFVSTEAIPAGASEQAAARSDKAEALDVARDEVAANAQFDRPVPSTAAAPPSSDAPDVYKHAPTQAEAGTTAALGAAAEGRSSGVESASPSDGYQVAVTAQQELIEELQEQKALLFDSGDVVQDPARSVAQQQVARRMQNRAWGVQHNQVQGPPAAPNRVRAVILLVPDQPQ